MVKQHAYYVWDLHEIGGDRAGGQTDVRTFFAVDVQSTA